MTVHRDPPPSTSPSPTGTPVAVAVPVRKKAPAETFRLPSPERGAASLPGDLAALRQNAASAADWRVLADRLVKHEFYDEASLAYARESAIYRTTDSNASRIEELKSQRYRTDVALFQEVPPIGGSAAARLEPARGCYVGAFIDRDDRLQSHMFGSQTFGDIGQFNALTGKRHASFFTYLQYGGAFPKQWAESVASEGAIPHLAWEPRSLQDVGDDAYLAEFVQEVKAFDKPIFLRFAGEMNGDWTPYHSDPAAYKAAFRKVYQAFRAAPKAALIWCPNAIPSNNLDEYYPGDDACDWVGVNFYSVLYLDNVRSQPGDWIHPIDLLEPVYRKYSKRKPIAIGEYAASHQSSLDTYKQPTFARLKIAQLYQSLPLLYPRVKLVSWYDCNNLLKARAGRQLNNYQLTDMPDVLDSYEEAVANGYYVGAGDTARWEARPLGNQTPPSFRLRVWTRSYTLNPIAFVRLDGKLIARCQIPKDPVVSVEGLKAGRHKLEVLVYDPRGRFVKKLETKIQVL